MHPGKHLTVFVLAARFSAASVSALRLTHYLGILVSYASHAALFFKCFINSEKEKQKEERHLLNNNL